MRVSHAHSCSDGRRCNCPHLHDVAASALRARIFLNVRHVRPLRFDDIFVPNFGFDDIDLPSLSRINRCSTHKVYSLALSQWDTRPNGGKLGQAGQKVPPAPSVCLAQRKERAAKARFITSLGFRSLIHNPAGFVLRFASTRLSWPLIALGMAFAGPVVPLDGRFRRVSIR